MSNSANPSCPKCSAAMALRTAKKGSHVGQKFYGCSRFPRCHGTRKFEELASASSSPLKTVQKDAKLDGNPFFRDVSQKERTDNPKVGTPLSDLQVKEVKRLRDKLLNLSSRNRSIKMNRIDKKSGFDLSRINALDPGQVSNLILHTRTKESSISLLPRKTTENEEAWNKLSGDLGHLYRNINEIYREKGLYDLYIGYPFLSGKPKGTLNIVQGPLFLIPVRLEQTILKKGAPSWTLTPRTDQRLIFNKTLFYALSKLCDLKINSELFEEDVPTDLFGENNFIQWTHKTLETYGIISNINEHALDESFDPVSEFAMKELPERFQTEGLTIFQNAVLGHFPQSNSSLQLDYEAFLNMSQEEMDGITCFLSEEMQLEQDYVPEDIVGDFDFSESSSEKESETIDGRPEKDNFFLLQSDSSQDRIVMELGKPNTDGIVVWGPPGTGKSQTIVNLIADCVAKGKTVLLVSQKRAALDVVFDRLASKGMDSLAAVVHDTREDRQQLYKKISALCSAEEKVGLEQIDPTEEINSISNILKNVTSAYNDKTFGECGGKIIRDLASYQGPIVLDMDQKFIRSNFDEILRLSSQLDGFQKMAPPSEPQDIVLNRKDFSKLSLQSVNSFSTFCRQNVQSEKTKLAVESLEMIASGLHGCVLGKNIDLETAIKTYQDTRATRFLRPSWWKAKSFIASNKASAARHLKLLNEQARIFLTEFFVPQFVQRLNLEAEFGENSIKVALISNWLEEHFDVCKSSDAVKNALPLDLQLVTQKIRDLGALASPVSWGSIFKYSVFELWSKELDKSHSVLSTIRADQVEGYRIQLKALLEKKNEYCAFLMRKRVAKSLETSDGTSFARTAKGEVDRKRNIPSIRKLNEKFNGNLYYRSVLPVWLVSPETVSDVFPLEKALFDVVIFDEASQCTVEHGLPAIYRGRQIVVAGDEKQLPPSKMFETSQEEDESEDTPFASEASLLTLARKTLRYKPLMLEWHYRSKHEELVAFSNQAFYHGQMKIAPNVTPSVSGNKPAIEWYGCKGYWENRSNLIEAGRTIDLLKEHLSQGKPPTVGIITFNANQKSLIQDLIDERYQADPEFAVLVDDNKKLPLDSQYFVKNIENVQGDERDVIIFSVAYAPSEPGGRVAQLFGLLNQSGGENRLNVAITRAIRKIQIVCSINPETDLNTSTSLNEGPKKFHQYLCYAKAVAEENYDRAQSILNSLNPNLTVRPSGKVLQFDSPFEEDVFKEITELGFEIHTQVGQSGFRIDLAVVHPSDRSKYVLGIECDGAMYHSKVSVRERDVFRQRFLESRGWKIHRIWSPSWRSRRDREIQKIKTLLKQLAS